jgi:hypothetical protein
MRECLATRAAREQEQDDAQFARLGRRTMGVAVLEVLVTKEMLLGCVSREEDAKR